MISGNESFDNSINTKKTQSFGITYPPIGLLYIAGSLELDDHDIIILDLNVEKNQKEKIKSLVNSVDAVGISIHNNYTPYDSYNKDFIANYIKEIDNEIPIIIGGPYCKLLGKDSLKNINSADICVISDGEFIINEIANSIQNQKSLKEIHGIYFWEKGKIVAGKKKELIKNIDKLPLPARHLVKKYDYGKLGNYRIFKHPLTTVITSRGCPYKCKFCINRMLDNEEYRQRSVNNVLNEINSLNGEYKTIMIGDNSFLSDKKHSEKILDGIIKNNLNFDILIGGTRVDSYNNNLYKKMKRAGVKYISFGIESGNQKVLDYYNKGTILSQIIKAIEMADNFGFFTVGTVILGAPFETLNDINKTVNFIYSLPLDFVNFYPLSYIKNSVLWKECVNKGLIEINEGAVLSDKKRGLGNFYMNELNDICYISTKKFYLRKKYLLKIFIKSLKQRNLFLISYLITHLNNY